MKHGFGNVEIPGAGEILGDTNMTTIRLIQADEKSFPLTLHEVGVLANDVHALSLLYDYHAQQETMADAQDMADAAGTHRQRMTEIREVQHELQIECFHANGYFIVARQNGDKSWNYLTSMGHWSDDPVEAGEYLKPDADKTAKKLRAVVL